MAARAGSGGSSPVSQRLPPYIAIARGIAEHPLFRHGGLRFTRREAWEWLLEQAAWKPKGHRHLFGVVDLGRGQLSLTVREMAQAWGWPATNVYRYMRRLQRDGMCNLHATGTSTGTIPGRPRLVITICNYDKFQPGCRKAEHHPEHQPEHQPPQLPGIVREPPAQAVQSKESIERKQAVRTCNRKKPSHGVPTPDGRFRWFDHGTMEWNAYAQDYLEVRGAAIMPVVYIGGRGNWFAYHGEATRKARRAR